MAVRRLPLPWDSQPALHDAPQIGDDLLPTALCLPNGPAWFDITTDGAWTANNTGSLAAATCAAGTSVQNTGTGYFSRTNPITTGPLTVVIVFTPTSVTGGHGIWSLATTPTSAAPHAVLQRNGADIRLWWQGSYRITFTGVAAIGVPLRIVLTFDTIADSSAQSARLAVNGAVQSASSAFVGNASKTTEYLGSGYNAQAQGHYSLYARASTYLDAGYTAELSANPWQNFSARSRFAFAPAAGSGGAVGIATETDTAFSLGAKQILPVGLCTESSAALALPALQSLACGLSAESDASIPLAAVQSLLVGISSETDTALQLGSGQASPVGIATETDTALALAAVQRLPVGMSVETDLALPLSSGVSGPVGTATESDVAFALVAVQKLVAGMAVETSTALALSDGSTPAPQAPTSSAGGGGTIEQAQRRYQRERAEEEEIAMVMAVLTSVGAFA